MLKKIKKQTDSYLEKLYEEKTELMFKYVLNMNDKIDQKERLKARERIKEIKQILNNQIF